MSGKVEYDKRICGHIHPNLNTKNVEKKITQFHQDWACLRGRKTMAAIVATENPESSFHLSEITAKRLRRYVNVEESLQLASSSGLCSVQALENLIHTLVKERYIRINVVDGKPEIEKFKVLNSFLAYEPSYRGQASSVFVPIDSSPAEDLVELKERTCDFSISELSFLFIFGPIGSGKSTIAQKALRVSLPEYSQITIELKDTVKFDDFDREVLHSLDPEGAATQFSSLKEYLGNLTHSEAPSQLRVLLLENVDLELLKRDEVTDALFLLASTFVSTLLVTSQCDEKANEIFTHCAVRYGNEASHFMFLEPLNFGSCKSIVEQHYVVIKESDQGKVLPMANCPLLLHQFGGLSTDSPTQEKLFHYFESTSNEKGIRSIAEHFFETFKNEVAKEALIMLHWFETSFTASKAAAVLGCEINLARRILVILHHVHFLQIVGQEKSEYLYHMHSLTKEVIKSKCMSSDVYKRIAEKGWVKYKDFYISYCRHLAARANSEYLLVYQCFKQERLNFEVIKGVMDLDTKDLYLTVKELIPILELALNPEKRLLLLDNWQELSEKQGDYFTASCLCSMKIGVMLKVKGKEAAEIGLKSAEDLLQQVSGSLKRDECRALWCYAKGQFLYHTDNCGNNLNEALHFHEEALKIREEKLDVSYSDLVRSYNEIGVIHLKKNNPKQAIEKMVKCCCLQKGFGETHPDYLVILENLASFVTKYSSTYSTSTIEVIREPWQMFLRREAHRLYLRCLQLTRVVCDRFNIYFVIKLLYNISNNCLFMQDFYTGIWFGLHGLLVGKEMAVIDVQCIMVSLCYLVNKGYQSLGHNDNAIIFLKDAMALSYEVPMDKRPRIAQKIFEEYFFMKGSSFSDEIARYQKMSCEDLLKEVVNKILEKKNPVRFLLRLCQSLHIPMNSRLVATHIRGRDKQSYRERHIKDFLNKMESSKSKDPPQDVLVDFLCSLDNEHQIDPKKWERDIEQMCQKLGIEYESHVLYEDVHEELFNKSQPVNKEEEGDQVYHCWLDPDFPEYSFFDLGITVMLKAVSSAKQPWELRTLVTVVRQPLDFLATLSSFDSIESFPLRITTDFLVASELEVSFEVGQAARRRYEDNRNSFHFIVKQFTEVCNSLETSIVTEGKMMYARFKLPSSGIYALILEPKPYSFNITEPRKPVPLCEGLDPGFKIEITSDESLCFSGKIKIADLHSLNTWTHKSGKSILSAFSVIDYSEITSKPFRFYVPVKSDKFKYYVFCQRGKEIQEISCCNPRYDKISGTLSFQLDNFSSYLIIGASFLGALTGIGLVTIAQNAFKKRTYYPHFELTHRYGEDSFRLIAFAFGCQTRHSNGRSIIAYGWSQIPCQCDEQFKFYTADRVIDSFRLEEEREIAREIRLQQPIGKHVTVGTIKNKHKEVVCKLTFCWSSLWRATVTKGLLRLNLLGLGRDALPLSDLNVQAFLKEFSFLDDDYSINTKTLEEQREIVMLELSIVVLSSSKPSDECMKISDALSRSGCTESAKELNRVRNAFSISWRDHWTQSNATWYMPIDFMCQEFTGNEGELLTRILTLDKNRPATNDIKEFGKTPYEAGYRALKAWYLEHLDVSAFDLISALYKATREHDNVSENGQAVDYLYKKVIKGVSSWVLNKDEILKSLAGLREKRIESTE